MKRFRKSSERQTRTANLRKDLVDAICQKYWNRHDLWASKLGQIIFPQLDSFELEFDNDHHERRSFTDHRDILSYEVPNLVYLRGSSGSGKTTFMKLFCLDWIELMKGEAQCEDRRNISLINFKYVIPLDLAFCNQRQRISDMIQEQLKICAEKSITLLEDIGRGQNRTLFVLDNLDEYRFESYLDIQELFSRFYHSNMYILVASERPAEHYFETNKMTFLTKVRLNGFSREGIKHYIKNFFRDNTVLEKQVLSSGKLYDFSRKPALLIMICFLRMHNVDLPQTEISIFAEFIGHVCRLKHNKTSKKPCRLSTFHSAYMAMGEFAFMMMAQGKGVIYPEDVTHRYLYSVTGYDDFLIRAEGFSNSFSFIHQSVRDYFIAYFISRSREEMQIDYLLNFRHKLDVFRHANTILIFLSDLGARKMVRYLNTFLSSVSKEEKAALHTKLQLRRLSGDPKLRMKLPETIHITITDKIAENVLKKYFACDGCALRELHLIVKDVRLTHYLNRLCAPNLKILSIRKQILDSSVHDSQTLSPRELADIFIRYQLVDLRLEDFVFPHTSIHTPDRPFFREILKKIRQFNTLERLSLEGTSLGPDFLHSIYSFKQSQIHSLNCSRCGLSLECAVMLLEKISECVTIKHLNIAGNKLGMELKEEITSKIDLSGLETFDISNNGFLRYILLCFTLSVTCNITL